MEDNPEYSCPRCGGRWNYKDEKVIYYDVDSDKIVQQGMWCPTCNTMGVEVIKAKEV
jgi:ribosomal protein S27AE